MTMLYDELVSAHGYQHNQLSLWSYPSGKKIQDFYGHEERVLHLVESPDGTVVCSGSEDETLRFWELFALDKELEKKLVRNKEMAKSSKLTSKPRLR